MCGTLPICFSIWWLIPKGAYMYVVVCKLLYLCTRVIARITPCYSVGKDDRLIEVYKRDVLVW